jgi:hypothetical protein
MSLFSKIGKGVKKLGSNVVNTVTGKTKNPIAKTVGRVVRAVNPIAGGIASGIGKGGPITFKNLGGNIGKGILKASGDAAMGAAALGAGSAALPALGSVGGALGGLGAKLGGLALTGLKGAGGLIGNTLKNTFMTDGGLDLGRLGGLAAGVGSIVGKSQDNKAAQQFNDSNAKLRQMLMERILEKPNYNFQ